MIYDEFIKNEARMVELRKALSILEDINALPMLIELGARNNPMETKTQEGYALRGAWSDGFNACVFTLAEFFQARQSKAAQQVRPDFGAKDFLVKNNVMTPEEYEQSRSFFSPGGADPFTTLHSSPKRAQT